MVAFGIGSASSSHAAPKDGRPGGSCHWLALGPVQLEHTSFHHNAHHHPIPAALLRANPFFPALGTPRADPGSVGQGQSCSTPQKWGVPGGRAQQLPPAAPCTNLPRQHQARLLSVPGWLMAASKRGQFAPGQAKPHRCVLTKAQGAHRGSLGKEPALGSSPRPAAWQQQLAARGVQRVSSAGVVAHPGGLIQAGFKVTEEPRHAVLPSPMGHPTTCLAVVVAHAAIPQPSVRWCCSPGCCSSPGV